MRDDAQFDSRVRKAVKLLNPPANQKEECARIILGDIFEMNKIELMRVVGKRDLNKQVKKAAGQLSTAIRRVEILARQFEPFTGEYWNEKISIEPSILEDLAELKDQAELVACQPSPAPKPDQHYFRMIGSAANLLIFRFSADKDWPIDKRAKLAWVLAGEKGSSSSFKRYVTSRAKPGPK